MAKALILNDLIQKINENIFSFEKKIGVGNSTIAKAIKRNSELKLDIVQKILDAYPNVSKQWLLTGDGHMFTDGTKSYEDAGVKSVQDITQTTAPPIEEQYKVLGLLQQHNKDLKDLALSNNNVFAQALSNMALLLTEIQKVNNNLIENRDHFSNLFVAQFENQEKILNVLGASSLPDAPKVSPAEKPADKRRSK